MRQIILAVILSTLVGVYVVMPKTKHIYLKTEIGEPKQYIELAQELEGFRGTVYVHLVGNGGDYEGAVYLMDLFDKMDNVVMEVDGTVQSAHAIIALSGKHIHISDRGFFMLHLTSGTNMETNICTSTEPGLDRGIPNETKCLEDLKATVKIYNKDILRIYARYLNAAELELVLTGHDVYISNLDMQQRVNLGTK